MPLLEGDEQRAAEALAALAWRNPFAEGREELERRALGARYRKPGGDDADVAGGTNDAALAERAAELTERAGTRLAKSRGADAATLSLYADLVRFHLSCRLSDLLRALGEACATGTLTRRRVSSFRLLCDELSRLGAVHEGALSGTSAPEHLFAVLFQASRARDAIARGVVGSSAAARALRAACWESIFGRDLRRYEHLLYARMKDVPTLVVGPPGSGQRDVAELVASTMYLPFGAETLRFGAESADATLVLDARACRPREAGERLFGRRSMEAGGEDCTGLFERCAPHGSVLVLQVDALGSRTQERLASALGSRTFTPDGDDARVPLRGKVIATSERDLAEAARRGRGRPALAWALSVDVIETPALADRLAQGSDDLRLLARLALERTLGSEHVNDTLDEVIGFLEAHRRGHEWPGHLDELDATVRSLLVRDTSGSAPAVPVSARERLTAGFRRGELDAERLLDAYCTIAYLRWGSYQEAARRLGLDRRTVRARIDEKLLDALRHESE